ncbi:hypothetical protein SNEBB_001513 [Seison nebaliae]|nr:hypothetical protein SNEBB_001513 [Seison nebaliae]
MMHIDVNGHLSIRRNFELSIENATIFYDMSQVFTICTIIVFSGFFASFLHQYQIDLLMAVQQSDKAIELILENLKELKSMQGVHSIHTEESSKTNKVQTEKSKVPESDLLESEETAPIQMKETGGKFEIPINDKKIQIKTTTTISSTRSRKTGKILNSWKPKKIWINIPGTDGYRRCPPIKVGVKENVITKSEVYVFEEFLSEDESRKLIDAHKRHRKMVKDEPTEICYDNQQSLNVHEKLLNVKFSGVSKNCLPGDLSKQIARKLMKNGTSLSHSTSFFYNENTFSVEYERRLKEATSLEKEFSGKYEIRYVGKMMEIPLEEDCTKENVNFITTITFLNTVDDGGELTMPKLGIVIKPKMGRLVVIKSSSEDGHCFGETNYSTNKVRDVEGSFVLKHRYFYHQTKGLGRRSVGMKNGNSISCRSTGAERLHCNWKDVICKDCPSIL